MLENHLRLLFVIPTLRTGGAEKYVLEIASKLAAAGHHTYVVSLGPIDKDFAKIFGSKYITVIKLPTKKVLSFRAIWVIYRLLRFIKEKKIDLVHLNLLGADILGGIAAILAGRPFVSTQHNTRLWRYSKKPKYLVYKHMHRFIMLFASVIITPTESVKHYLAETTNIPFGKMTVVYHGIDLSKFSSRFKKIRRKIKIGSTGRFEPRKGQIYIVEALPKVLSQFKNKRIELLFAGDGTYQHEVRERAQQLNVSEHVAFLGRIYDIPRFLSEIDILVHAGVSGEAFCYAALEAMASGRATIVTNIDGIPEFVEDHYNGILIPIKSPRAIADALIELITKPYIFERISKNAPRSVRPYFSIERMIEETTEVYFQFSNRGFSKCKKHLMSPQPSR